MQSNAFSDILIFDSGVGGLSILKEVQQALPHATIAYCSDNEAYPYGTKSEEELTQRIEHVMQRLIRLTNPQLIVIACNSASTLALAHLRALTDIPIVGVVPAIKTAAARSRSKSIGLLATPATIRRPYTQRLIDEFAQGCQVTLVGSSELVELAEQKLRNQPIDTQLIRSAVAPFLNKNIDAVVLGCTHFPLLNKELYAALPGDVELIDSAPAIARQAVRLFQQHDLKPYYAQGDHSAVFTAAHSNLSALTPYLQSLNINNVNILLQDDTLKANS